jgi:hypothetical protein
MIGKGAEDLLITLVPSFVDQSYDLLRGDAVHRLVLSQSLEPFPCGRHRKVAFEHALSMPDGEARRP